MRRGSAILLGLLLGAISALGVHVDHDDTVRCDPTVYADGTPAPCFPEWNGE